MIPGASFHIVAHTMPSPPAGNEISTILRHDSKQTSYKIALLRSINDVVLNFPDLADTERDVAVPLLLLADFWIAYYWSFAHPDQPIYQGPRATLDGSPRNDMAFRPELRALRYTFHRQHGGSTASDGFFLINQLRMPRKRKTLSSELLESYRAARTKVARTIRMPIRYAGPGEWQVFPKPTRRRELSDVVAVPGTSRNQSCLVVRHDLWRSFQNLSLWVEALCIHEWSLFTESVDQPDENYERGDIFSVLTSRPDNRVSLTWERNQIDILLMEGECFICPWTGTEIRENDCYNLDHLLPVSVYPMNEMWNLAPADPRVNKHKKRDRIPSQNALQRARPRLARTYEKYQEIEALNEALRNDVSLRFSSLPSESETFSQEVAEAATSLIDRIGTYRNLARFDP